MPHQWTRYIVQSFKLCQERIQTHHTLPHNDCEVKSLAQDQSRAFPDENIFKRNFKVIQSDPFSKGFIVIKDVRKIWPQARGHGSLTIPSTSTLIPNCYSDKNHYLQHHLQSTLHKYYLNKYIFREFNGLTSKVTRMHLQSSWNRSQGYSEAITVGVNVRIFWMI